MVSPVLQLYVFAPLAVKVTGVPAQTVAEFTVTVGEGFTVTTGLALASGQSPVTV